MQFNVLPLAVLMCFATQLAFFLPGSSMFAALGHTQAMHMGKKNGFLWGGMIMIAVTLSLFILIPVGYALF